MRHERHNLETRPPPSPPPVLLTYLPRSFRGLATFTNNWCDINGGGVFNGPDSKIT